MSKATLYLLPTTLGEMNYQEVLPETIKQQIEKLTYFIVENEKTARRFIKLVAPEKKQSELIIFQLNKHNKFSNLHEFIQPLLQGNDMGLLSEAGLPAIADPGSLVIDLAHKNKIIVKPFVGPSSLLLALMASGLNGQHFSFHGYLPIDSSELKQKLKIMEQKSMRSQSAEIFIETPYRNQKMFEQLVKTLHNNTKLCIATDLTLPTETIQTLSVKNCKNKKVDLHKRPTVFIFQA